MFNKKARLLFSLLTLTLLTACGNTTQASDGLEDVEAAITKNSNLESGIFETTQTMKSDGNEHEQKVEGAFIRKGTKDYDWYRTVYYESSNEDNFSTIVEIDGKQLVNSSPEETVWNEAPEATANLNNQIGPLLEVEDYEIEFVTTEEIDGETYYYVTLDALHGEQVKKDAVDALKENIKILKETNAGEDVIKNIEEEIERREQATYSDFVYTYKIDEDGYVTHAEFESKMVEATGTEFEFISSYTLTDYNLMDLSNLLPEVE